MPRSGREAVRMSEAEVAAFVAEQRTVVCATNGPRGWPHLMPLWYVVRDGDVWASTYRSSQKVQNLRRDPRATLQLEAGTEYAELRGVMIEADTVIDEDTETVAALIVEVARRYGQEPSTAQAPKRVALRFVARRVASWDHRKRSG